ncbi:MULTISPECIES: DUF397 domain-containing protein [Nocardia]|uniref:DUF397 domain-containing protein n=1 Tax=Nocardia sputorum TaxID=2984338 RepID=A0ABN6U0S1_9NOCA|nr:DUF397 domain-containing protein [Nocardia sputorum]BDT98824.1 hypothetical protein IFM12276_18530 [Nocardia sputorum]
MDSLEWRVSSFTDNGTCVEVAGTPSTVYVRNSNAREAGTVAFTREEWGAFLKGAQAGEFDDLA